MDGLDRRLALAQGPRLGAHALRAAAARLGRGGAADEALRYLVGAPAGRLCELGLRPDTSAVLARPDLRRLARERERLLRADLLLLDALDSRYPQQLLTLPDAPALLYVRGDVRCLQGRQLAVVGSRNPSGEGCHAARQFAGQIAAAGVTVTSGLALGIDAAAHEGALAAGGTTIAVLACGLDRPYPPAHEALARRIAHAGALLAELPPGTPPRRCHFPRRNRLIAALTLGVLVIEAAPHSGSLITARLAAAHGRRVLAVPGSIRNPLAQGCHALIRAGARLVQSPAEVLQELGLSLPEQLVMPLPPGPPGTGTGARPLDNGYEILLDALGFAPAGIDELVVRSGLASHSVAAMLLMLELEGTVQRQTDGRYLRSPE